jgi:diadenosine tetraphosphate (Ap4A) HIT family hydrolase
LCVSSVIRQERSGQLFTESCEHCHVSSRNWPADWERRREGDACVMCAQGRPDVDENGNRRFFAGEVADGYLQRSGPVPGYAIVAWRGRHVPDVSEMAEADLFAYWAEVVQVARALTHVFEPCHLNYQLLGNAVPHVHTHIVPRYVDDPCPNMPLKPWVLHAVPEDAYADQVERLKTFFES